MKKLLIVVDNQPTYFLINMRVSRFFFLSIILKKSHFCIKDTKTSNIPIIESSFVV